MSKNASDLITASTANLNNCGIYEKDGPESFINGVSFFKIDREIVTPYLSFCTFN